MEEEKTQSGQTSADEGDVDEMFVSGFCKMQNQSRMVICEVRTRNDGTKEILSSDCAWGKCEHSRTCLLMGQIQ